MVARRPMRCKVLREQCMLDLGIPIMPPTIICCVLCAPMIGAEIMDLHLITLCFEINPPENDDIVRDNILLMGSKLQLVFYRDRVPRKSFARVVITSEFAPEPLGRNRMIVRNGDRKRLELLLRPVQQKVQECIDVERVASTIPMERG